MPKCWVVRTEKGEVWPPGNTVTTGKAKMRRKEAEKLLGTNVQAWTSANGVYVGVLREVYGSPWRGKVEITGVLTPAVPMEFGRMHQRRGLRPGFVVDVGGCNIKPTADVGASYLESLQVQLRAYEHMLQGCQDRDRHIFMRSIEEIKKRIGEEELQCVANH